MKRARAGEGISYGLTWRAPADTTVATIPIGYGDGYSRALSNRAMVRIGGADRPLVGRICMDQSMVDLGPEAKAARGRRGRSFSARKTARASPGETLCEILGTIPYELTCMVGSRMPRVYVED